MKIDLKSFLIGALSVAVIGLLLFQIREEQPEPSGIGRYTHHVWFNKSLTFDTETGDIYLRGVVVEDQEDYETESWRINTINEVKESERADIELEMNKTLEETTAWIDSLIKILEEQGTEAFKKALHESGKNPKPE